MCESKTVWRKYSCEKAVRGPGKESNWSFDSAPAPAPPDSMDGRVTHIGASNFGLAAIVSS